LSLVGLLAALLRARETGTGDHVDISMTDGAFSLLSIHLGDHFVDGKVPTAEGATLNGRYPCYNVYECADGLWITVGALEEKFFAAVCGAVGRPELWETRLDETAVPLWRELFRARSRNEWLKILGEETCTGPVNDVAQAVIDPQLRHRRMVVAWDDPEAGCFSQLATPIKLREHPASIYGTPPGLGADTRDCLLEAGMPAEQIEALIDANIAATADAEPLAPAS
jgi:crotonobetainyl-CoA:carnitine CoA-transferase CaiB-like acyl-CoA transferase